jgi:hypothetical protein
MRFPAAVPHTVIVDGKAVYRARHWPSRRRAAITTVEDYRTVTSRTRCNKLADNDAQCGLHAWLRGAHRFPR